jgi:hypothetical protein
MHKCKMKMQMCKMARAAMPGHLYLCLERAVIPFSFVAISFMEDAVQGKFTLCSYIDKA